MELLHAQKIGAVQAISLPKNVWGLGQLRHYRHSCPRYCRSITRSARNVTEWVMRNQHANAGDSFTLRKRGTRYRRGRALD